jgi:hypothetical protein
MHFKKIVFRLTLSSVFALALASALIGLAHTPTGRQTWIGKKVMTTLVRFCPARNLSAQAVDRFMEIGLAKLRGPLKAPARPALDFQLDETREPEVLAKMAARGLKCEEKKVGYLLVHCSASLADDTTFVFGGNGKLKSISVYRTNLPESSAEELWQKTAQNLHHQLGQPTQNLGKPELNAQQDVLDLHSYEYRFKDYYAKITIYNKGEGRALYERYQSTL